MSVSLVLELRDGLFLLFDHESEECWDDETEICDLLCAQGVCASDLFEDLKAMETAGQGNPGVVIDVSLEVAAA